MKNFTFTFKDTELGIDSVIFRKKYNKKSCEYDYIESKITMIKITKDRLWVTINKIDDDDKYLVFDLNDEAGFAKDVLYVEVPEDKTK